jgi:hypothetical protein
MTAQITYDESGNRKIVTDIKSLNDVMEMISKER